MRALTRTLLALALLQLALAAPASAAAAPKAGKASNPAKAPAAERPEWGRLIAQSSDALVAVKFVLQLKGAKGSDRSSEEEAFCLLLDPSGIVLCPSGYIGIAPQSLRRSMGGMSATPTEFKVLVGDDPEGYEARLLARDADLELAWLQIKAPGKKLPALDLSARPQPQVGDKLLTLQRTPRYLGRAPIVSENALGGTATRPRPLLMLAGLGLAPGVPVFSNAGVLVGVTIAQRADEGERPSLGQRVPTLVLSVEELAAATKRAQEPPASESGGADGGVPAAPPAVAPSAPGTADGGATTRSK
jgi:hypothetical protein